MQSNVEGFGVVLRHDGKDSWCDNFGPGMPVFVEAEDVERFLDNATQAEEAFQLLQPFNADRFSVTQLDWDSWRMVPR